MKNKILELIEFKKIDNLLDGFKKTTGLATAILNLDGTILSHSEWRKLCTDFYQKNPETSNWCSEIKIELAEKLADGENFHIYKCSNGLIELAIPILINGEHFANLFSGFFFIDEPDFIIFNSERKQYGFEKIKYNEALSFIPVIPLGKIKTTMEFLLGTIQFIVELALQKLNETKLKESLAINKLLVENIIDNSPTLIYVANTEGKFKLVNKEFQKTFDLPKSEILGKSRQEIMPVVIAGQHRNNDLEVIQSRKSIVTEEENIEIDGTHFYISQKFPLFDLNGEINAVGGISTDITEKKRTEEALRKSENKYKSLFENSADGILLTNEQSEILELNSKICEILGYKREELIVINGLEIIHSDDLINYDYGAVVEQLKEGKTLLTNYRLRKKDGTYIPTELTTKMIDEGQFLNIVRDISERVLAEKIIKESETKYRSFFENSIDAILLTSTDGKIHSANPAACAMFECSESEIIQLGREGLTDPSDSRLSVLFDIRAEKGKVFGEITMLRKDRTPFEAEISSSIFGNTDTTLYSSIIIRDISVRKQVEQSLQESEEKFKQIFLTSPDFVTISQIEDGTYMDVNDRFIQTFGYTREEIIGKTAIELNIWTDTEDREQMLAQLIECGKVVNFKAKFTQKDGRILEGLLSASILLIKNKPCLLIITRDITELKHAEEALKLSEEKFEKSFRLSPYMVSLSTMEGEVIETNDRIFDTLGYTIAEFVGSNTTSIPLWVNPSERENFVAILKQNKTLDNLEVQFRKKSGEIGDYLLSACVIEVNENKILLSIIYNITQRKKKEKALLESEQRYRDLFENSYAIMLLVDPESGNIVDANPAASQFYGWSNAELISMNLSKINTNSLEERKKILQEASESKKNHFFFNHIIADGSLHNVEVYSAPIYSKGKKLLYSIVHDITDRKQTEKALLNEKNLLSAIIENIPVMLTRYDPGTNMLYLNKEFEEKIGWKTEDLQTINLMEKVYPDPEYRAETLKYMESLSTNWKEFHVNTKAGDVIDSEWRNIRLDDGTQIGIGIDITEEKKNQAEIIMLNTQLESKVKQRTAQLEEINKELETFTYSVSHDLKAPLRGIDGYSKLLADIYKPDLNVEAQSFIEKIRTSTLQMNQIIDDLLDYSRLERSQLTIGKIKIKDLIESVLSMYTAELEAGYFKINTKIKDIEIIADTKGFIIAFRNLIENAIKFTKGKSNPTIEIEIEEKELSWIISVNDNGIGFDMKYHHKIFDIFQRLQRTEDYPGTGIGLALVSKAMQRMHGKTWAESIPNVGSTFYLEIPKNQ